MKSAFVERDNAVDTQTKQNLIYSVSELSAVIQQFIVNTFGIVAVRGEISGIKVAASGHQYFSIKDDGALLNVICWRTTKLDIKLEEGLEVICYGKLTTYPERSVYQLIVNNISISGVGALLAILEKRKNQFISEGLFDQGRKKKLPMLPAKIGVITSISGAVIKDIMHRIEERCPVSVLVWGVTVQGKDASQQIIEAICGFCSLPNVSNYRPDVIIIARGGGSVEDLWAFNDEALVRAVANSTIPIVSAIGHETDYTLLDFVADVRAPTPTAAAEMVVPVKSELEYKLSSLARAALHSIDKHICKCTLKFDALSHNLMHAKCVERCSISIQKAEHNLTAAIKAYVVDKSHKLQSVIRCASLDRCVYDIKYVSKNLLTAHKDLDKGIVDMLLNCKRQLVHVTQMLEGCDYTNVLQRGFAIISRRRDKVPKLIVNVGDIGAVGEVVTIEMHDGTRDATLI